LGLSNLEVHGGICPQYFQQPDRACGRIQRNWPEVSSPEVPAQYVEQIKNRLREVLEWETLAQAC